jgi:hypothetical protein
MPNEASGSGRRCPHCGNPPGLRWSALLPSNSRDRSYTCLVCGGRYDTSDMSKMASIFGGLLGIGPGIYVLGILVKGHSGSALAVGAGTLMVVAAFGLGSISLAWLALRLEAKR